MPVDQADQAGPVYAPGATAAFGQLDPDPAQRGRVELHKPRLDQLICTKGYRLAWSRAGECPCAPVDPQLNEPTPNCPLCEGSGLFYFGTDNRRQWEDQTFTPAQRMIVRRTRSAVIRGMMSGLSVSDTMTDRMGEWRHGSAVVTVLSENKIAFRDRLVNLDAKVVFREVVKMAAGTLVVPLRYVVNDQVMQLRSAARAYRTGLEYRVADGELRFVSAASAPPPGTRLSVNYLTCPTWLVMDQPHVERLYNPRPGITRGLRGRAKAGVGTKGPTAQLPLQAMVQMQFIPHNTVSDDGGTA